MHPPIKVLTVGCGHMGTSHSRAYMAIDGFELVGLVARTAANRDKLAAELGGQIPGFSDYASALREIGPDAVSINTYPDTHAAYAIMAMEAGAHVFLEKPIGVTLAEARNVVDAALANGRKLVIGYILRHHPSWKRFIEIARSLGKPLVMRMNLNQQSAGSNWNTHKNLMNSMSPIVDCGVHYVDVMCQMTRAKPLRVSAIGARLTNELVPGMVNYGQLQVTFDDGSCGWYEAGWGPMMSETACFVKDVIGPLGSVSIATSEQTKAAGSDDVNAHSRTDALLLHHAELGPDGKFMRPDEPIYLTDEPDHDALCRLEQEYFLRAIHEDLDLCDHMRDAIDSLAIVLAADEAFRTGTVVSLQSA